MQGSSSGGKAEVHFSSISVLHQPLTLLLSPGEARKRQTAEGLTPPAMPRATCAWADLPRLKKAQADELEEGRSRKPPP